MKFIYFLYILFISFSISLAQDDLTSAFEFLRTDFNPRTAAMSNAFLSPVNDVSNMYVNPAGLSYIEQDQYAINYTNHILDINGGMAAFARKFQKYGVLSVGILYMDYGDFEETNENAQALGHQFGANDFALGIGIANHLDEQFSYGVNMKYAFSKLESYNASAIVFDFGLYWAVPFTDNLSFAVTLMNVGHQFDYYKDSKEDLPVNFRMGASKKLAHLPLEIALSINEMNVDTEEVLDLIKRFSAGGEFTLSEKLRLRIGYDNDLHTDVESNDEYRFGGVSVGFGIYFKKLRIDYAYSNYGALGGISRFGLFGTLD
jgi:hypothetical protein